MTLAKKHLVKAIHYNPGYSKAKSITLIQSLLEIIKNTLESGKDVLISGFGKFCVKEKNERRGRNPATAEEMMLGARRVVTFRCSSVLRERINGKG
jgi:integration host factor subunit alpha